MSTPMLLLCPRTQDGIRPAYRSNLARARLRPRLGALVRTRRIRHSDQACKRDEAVPPTSGLTLIYAELREELLRFLTARCGDRGEAEELLQELWVRVQAVDAGPIANARSYLYRAAQNLVLDRVRARRRQAVRDDQWAATQSLPSTGGEAGDVRGTAEDDMIAREEAAALAAAIAALPAGAGRVLRLHKFDGLSHAEVAQRLGISRSGVEKHIAVAMAHLRRALID